MRSWYHPDSASIQENCGAQFDNGFPVAVSRKPMRFPCNSLKAVNHFFLYRTSSRRSCSLARFQNDSCPSHCFLIQLKNRIPPRIKGRMRSWCHPVSAMPKKHDAQTITVSRSQFRTIAVACDSSKAVNHLFHFRTFSHRSCSLSSFPNDSYPFQCFLFN
ncbi:hypothetical protein HNO89_003546 [Sporosarcina luteola]|nr:hypothetical protein [Sporosarcina luteola]